MMKVHQGRVLGGVAAGVNVIILGWCLFGSPIDITTASAALPLNDGAATWHVAESSPVAALTSGATMVTRTIAGPARCKLTLVFFDEKSCTVQAVSQSSSSNGGKLVAEWAAQTRAIACCNGGYFDPSTMKPSNLEIAGGVRTGTLGSSGSSGGAFGCLSGVLFLENERDFRLSDDVTELIMCGPMLVQNGRPANVADERVRNRRTFIATDGHGRWAIGTAESASYSGLAAMLVNRQIIPEFQIMAALNLDGGPSTALWWRDSAGMTGGVKQNWPVRNVLLVIPR